MTIDGKLLNFGKGSTSDHNAISNIGYSVSEFIDEGNIRMKPETSGIELFKAPSSEQDDTLFSYFSQCKGEKYVDIGQGSTAKDCMSYAEQIPASKIISDIRYYFKNGEFPRKSEFADFRYKLTNKELKERHKEQLDALRKKLKEQKIYTTKVRKLTERC